METTRPRSRSTRGPSSIREALSSRELRASRRLVRRVLAEVDAELEQAALFGSRARGEGRPDSDVDILLVFARLPFDREPQAGHAEAIAEQVAAETGVPVTVWSVSLIDLREGMRTPMLVDALHDSLPVWCAGEPIPSLAFTPRDALRCSRCLLERVEEGSEEFVRHLQRGDPAAAVRRVRDDVVRLCTANLLLCGITRPRRADAVRTWTSLMNGAMEGDPVLLDVLGWAGATFGEDGRQDDLPVPPPPGGLHSAAAAIDRLRQAVGVSRTELAERFPEG
jgi:predicted nucleotidyltransferase